MTYSEKLRDPRWQKKRLECLERGQWTCEDCGNKEKTLHVHHGRYDKDKDPWEYEPAAYHVLCENCHDLRHEMERIVKWNLSFMSTKELVCVRMLLTGLYGSRFKNPAEDVVGKVKSFLFDSLWILDLDQDGNDIPETGD